MKKTNINILITMLIVVIDQISKELINIYLRLNESIKIINNFFYITNAHNEGAAWSILSGNTLILIIITFIAIYLIHKYTKEYKGIFKYILYGGIIGNLIDRIFYGYVRDFIDFRIFNYNYPVFNISDICIFIGIFILVIKIVKDEKNGSTSRRCK